MSNKQKNLHKRAQVFFHANRLKEALELYRKLCRLNDNDTQAWHMAGAIAGMSGDHASAKTCCEKVIALSPNTHGPYLNLANILMATGRFQEAMQRFQQALRLKPGDPQTLTNLANLHTQLGQFEQATECLQNAIHANPGYPEAHNNLGNLYREMSKLEEAQSCFHQALKIKPDYVDALCNLGATLSDQLKFVEAENCYSRALQIAPDNIAALRNLGNLYQSTGEFEQAKQCYEKVLKSTPSDINTLSSLATLHERCGDAKAALELLSPLIRSRQYDADSALTYAKLCSKQGNDESGIQTLSETLNTPVSPNKIIDIYFAMGELYDHSGQYDHAFNYFRKANDLDTGRQPTQNPDVTLKPTIEFFSRDRLKKLPRASIDSEVPVFIVGMPRTGTSLVEQILASHPLVSAGGERGDIFNIIDSITRPAQQGTGFPALLESIEQDTLDELVTQHLNRISTLGSDCIRFTDKTPLHGLHLGFISQLFPRSRVIICNRNALDTCLSIYFHRFNAFHGYANQLDTLGCFFREYYKLMQHWIDVLDIEILSIQYEALAREPDKYIRNIINFCGLNWDNNCLLFHKNKRTVNTPSYDQVRKPMYTNAIDRWKHYDKHLASLRKALD